MISTTVELLESPAFLDHLRARLDFPRSSDVGGSVDIQALKVNHRKGSAELELTVDAKVEQPPVASGKRWVVFKWGNSGVSQTDYRLEFPCDECLRAVPEVLFSMQAESAHRVIEEKMYGLDRLRQGLKEELRNVREPLDYLRQKCGIFPPDNQSEAMRQVRLLEQKRMDLSVQIKAIRGGDMTAEVEQELARLYPLLHATEEKLESLNETVGRQLEMLSEIESLQRRINSLTGQMSDAEKEINQLRSSPVVPRFTLSLLNER
jgi:vacuolar-type H+-ATPase subunit D/Vma8